ncbi:cob(I)yrinic acid a,c-diamide adenosyltransferase [Flammeovirgaceae bacterium SG7u.111]|nr:cob(I)yrinic acid a,c-diamide adenosyltransferase [Flammeovirgaceae bacterium SG7u.132]WPO36895.1 cob(I)yrinic acid a,c-diamide adenosyltransferase [Flammeovirgaceae bacterium SG7u.111]
MKIYTKTGDKGTTSLLGGKRVSKAHARIDAYGTVDELNSYVGLVRDQKSNEGRKELLVQIQERLFTLGSSLAADPEKDKLFVPDIYESDIETLETAMDEMDSQLPPMKNFVLPGGHQSVSFCHLARVVCRRAERLCIKLSESEEVDDKVVRYLNRLSDFFFVLGRKMSVELNAEEIPWKPREKKN